VLRMESAVAPYARFVRSEADRWTTAQRELTSLRGQTSTFLERLAEPTARPSDARIA